VGLALAAGMTWLQVHVDKNSNGDEKTVQVDTPLAAVHVNTDQTTAADLGLPVYPGAQPTKSDDKHKSAACTSVLANGSCVCGQFPTIRPIRRSRFTAFL